MLFNSIDFAVFLPVVFFLYWFVTGKNLRLQNFLIVASSFLFYGWWDWRFLFLMVFSASVDYFVGLALGKEQRIAKRKILLGISVVINLGILGFFKYFNFFVDTFIGAFSFFGMEISGVALNVVLPVGISFYTFQALSYSIDVYRRQLEPTADVVAYFAFISFFPQLVAGPIERATHLLPQFYVSRKFTYAYGVTGMRLILWGLFKKIVIADNCAQLVNHVFENYGSVSGLELGCGVVFFAFQIYCDFSGYSDIAKGTAHLFGFDLMINFKTPYFSRDVAEFWRRWHISLTTWFRDYLYIPIGGSKNGKWKTIVNTLIVFVVSGFWHGANWTFIIWGILNALLFIPLLVSGHHKSNLDTVAAGRILPSAREIIQMTFTFILICFTWVFFRSVSISSALDYFHFLFSSTFLPIDLKPFQLWLFPVIMFWIALEWISRGNGFPAFVNTIRQPLIRYAIYYSLVMAVFLFGAFHETPFIYFQF